MTMNSLQVLNLMKEHYGEPMSKQNIANALHISVPAVTGTINALQKKGYCVVDHEEEEVVTPATETRKAKVKIIKFHVLTEEGLAYDPVKEEEEKAALKEANKAARAAKTSSKKAD